MSVIEHQIVPLLLADLTRYHCSHLIEDQSKREHKRNNLQKLWRLFA